MESSKPFVREQLREWAKGASRHQVLKSDEWYIGKFRKDDIQFPEGRKLNDELEKYMFERLQDEINNTNKTVKPIKEVFTNNVITNIGLQQSIDRDIGAVSTTVDWMSLGTSSTAEAVTDTDLVAELTDTAYARKQLSVAGTRTRTDQTALYAQLWDDTVIDTPPKAVLESGLHWHLSNSNACHARAVFSSFTIDSGDTLVIRATELQTNGAL